MKESYENKYHILEDKNWWFCSRRDIILKLLKKFSIKSRILDIGCSKGVLINLLKLHGYKNVYGIDISKKAVLLCKKRGLKNIYLQGVENTKFPSNKFDIIICSDVLEHIKNQDKAIIEINRILKLGGKVICFVPAFNFLWSSHDIENMHYRRYSKNELYFLFKKNGYNILKISYWNFLLFTPVLILNHLKKSNDNLYYLNRYLNYILSSLLKIENWFLMKGFCFPFGISVFITAEKMN